MTLEEALKGLAEGTLTSINLSYSMCWDEHVIQLAQALKTNTTLTSINLSHNYIQDKGAEALLKVIGSRNRTLLSVELEGNKISQEFKDQIIEALMFNRDYQKLIQDVLAKYDKAPKPKSLEELQRLLGLLVNTRVKLDYAHFPKNEPGYQRVANAINVLEARVAFLEGSYDIAIEKLSSVKRGEPRYDEAHEVLIAILEQLLASSEDDKTQVQHDKRYKYMLKIMACMHEGNQQRNRLWEKISNFHENWRIPLITKIKDAVDELNREEAIGLISEMKPKIKGEKIDTSEAEEVMIYILDKARQEAIQNYGKLSRGDISRDELKRRAELHDYTEMLRALFEQFPTMDVNKKYKYGSDQRVLRGNGVFSPYQVSDTELPKTFHKFNDRPLPSLIEVRFFDGRSEVDLAIFKPGTSYIRPLNTQFTETYSEVSPLLLSMFYDMPAITDLLLAHSNIDTNIGDVLERVKRGKETTNETRSCYDWASGINADTGSGIGQFGRSLIGDDQDCAKKIVVHHLLKNKAGIQLPTRFSASEIRELLFNKIMKEVNAEKDPEARLTILKKAIAGSDSIPSDSALWAFLNTKGLLSSKTEKEKLDESLMAEVQKIMAKRTAPADPTTVPLKTAFSSASLNADPVEPEGPREESSSSYFGNKKK